MSLEGVKLFITRLDAISLEMHRGVFKVVFVFSRKRYTLKIYRENACVFAAEGTTLETPIRMLENHALFLKLVAETLRTLKPFAAFEEQKEEEEQEEEEEEQEEEEREE